MPWTVKQVDRFKKNLSKEEKERWVKVANATLEKKIKEGVAVREAEIIAIKKANALFGGEEVNVLTFEQMRAHEELKLAKINDVEKDWQLVIPIGTTYSEALGEIILTEGFMEDMVSNQSALKNTQPYLNERHDRGKALGWVNDMRVSDEGLEVKFDFNTLGKHYLENNVYRYYSGEIKSVRDIDTGNWVYPVFAGVALTNSPVMKNMPEAHLSEQTKIKPKDEYVMKFDDLKKEVIALSEEHKKLLRHELQCEQQTEIDSLTIKLEAANDLNKQFKEKNTLLENKVAEHQKTKIDELLKKMIDEGKLKPADKDKWTQRLSKDFDTFYEIVMELPKIIDLDNAKGSSQDIDEVVNFGDRRYEFVTTENRREVK